MQPWVYFLTIGAVFFLMMRGGCGSHVMGHGHHHRSEAIAGRGLAEAFTKMGRRKCATRSAG